MKKIKPGKILAARAEKALLEQLPLDQKALTRAAKILESGKLKRVAIAAAGGAMALSFLGTVGEMRLYRVAMKRELKKQLAPINKKLDELEEQNEELRRQNAQLQRQLSR